MLLAKGTNYIDMHPGKNTAVSKLNEEVKFLNWTSSYLEL